MKLLMYNFLMMAGNPSEVQETIWDKGRQKRSEVRGRNTDFKIIFHQLIAEATRLWALTKTFSFQNYFNWILFIQQVWFKLGFFPCLYQSGCRQQSLKQKDIWLLRGSWNHCGGGSWRNRLLAELQGVTSHTSLRTWAPGWMATALVHQHQDIPATDHDRGTMLHLPQALPEKMSQNPFFLSMRFFLNQIPKP